MNTAKIEKKACAPFAPSELTDYERTSQGRLMIRGLFPIGQVPTDIKRQIYSIFYLIKFIVEACPANNENVTLSRRFDG
jgi:hypothetical protein